MQRQAMEACIILPNSDVANAATYTFPATTLSGGPTLDSMYFSFDVQETTEPGQTQSFQTVVSNYATNVLTTAIVGPQTSVDVVDVVGGDTKLNNGSTVRPAPDVPVGASFGVNCPSGVGTLGESAFTKCNGPRLRRHPPRAEEMRPHANSSALRAQLGKRSNKSRLTGALRSP